MNGSTDIIQQTLEEYKLDEAYRSEKKKARKMKGGGVLR